LPSLESEATRQRQKKKVMVQANKVHQPHVVPYTLRAKRPMA